MKKVISLDVYDERGQKLGKKRFYTSAQEKHTSINKWIKSYDDKNITELTYMGNPSPDFQHTIIYFAKERD